MTLALVVTDAVAVIVGALIVAAVVLVVVLRDKPHPIRARFGVFFERVDPTQEDHGARRIEAGVEVEVQDDDDGEDTLVIPPK